MRTSSSGDAQHHRHVVAWAHRAAGAGVQRVVSGRRVVFADRRARLHRDAGDALHPGAERTTCAAAANAASVAARVAHLGVEAEIRCGIATRRAAHPARPRCAGMRSPPAAPRSRPRPVRRHPSPRRDWSATTIATMSPTWRTSSVGHRIMRRNERRRAVRVVELDVGGMTGAHRMRDRLQSVRQQIASGQHREHARGGSAPRACRSTRISACACGERTITA